MSKHRDETLTERLGFRVSASQRLDWFEVARAEGRSLANWLRRVADDAAGEHRARQATESRLRSAAGRLSASRKEQ
jgi:hypothetical protein